MNHHYVLNVDSLHVAIFITTYIGHSGKNKALYRDDEYTAKRFTPVTFIVKSCQKETMMQQRRDIQRVTVEPWEIGGELLDILSRGLYTDAKDSIREYVQNGIDAGANTIIVNVSGPVVMIRDDGHGMGMNELRKARRFGISDKNPKLQVGYRGIGIYASFGMCEGLVITTRKSGMRELLHLRIDFGPMRRTLEKDRVAEKRAGVALTNLLYEHTGFYQEDYDGNAEDQFTLVTLEGLLQEYRAQLTDLDKIKTYLLNTVPITFPDQGYGSVINGWLREHVGLNPVKILLRIEKEPETAIEQPIAKDVSEPQYQIIKDAQGHNLAFIWYCLSNKGERLTSPNGADEGSGTSGFLLKLKGFTLGDRTRLKPLWPPVGGRTLYHHYTGEVHALDNAEVFPNAARNDLEPGESKQVLIRYLRDYFDELSKRADLSRSIISIQRRLKGFQVPINNLLPRKDEPNEDIYDLYWESKNYLTEIDKIENEVLRLTQKRGRRKIITPTTEQQEQLEKIKTEIANLQSVVVNVIQSTSKRTEAHKVPSRPAEYRQQPPQAALLEKALNAVRDMLQRMPTQELQNALGGLESATSLIMVSRAVDILDGLVASGVSLSEEAEACRKELRAQMGLSPVAPVSLEQALVEEGFSPATPREQALIKAIDSGILIGIGGRGKSMKL